MIYPIVAYGDAVLRKVGQEILESQLPEIKQLVEDMFATMEKANGVGLAAPQIGKSLRLFVVDTNPMQDEDSQEPSLRQAFLNAEMLEEKGTEWAYEEGCLSLPGIREKVLRKPKIKLRYRTLNWQLEEKEFDGYTARVIQHEYDHIEGKLFIDHISPLKRSLLQSKLERISKGNIEHEYRMKFPKKS
jgi:peptide deformylase